MIIMPRFDGNAACAETDPDAFFPEPGGEGKRVARQAQAICSGCEVKTPCLQWALEQREPFGIWAGLTEHQRRRLITGPPKPASRAQDINHGTESGDKQHRRRGETPCIECRDAARLAGMARRDRRIA